MILTALQLAPALSGPGARILSIALIVLAAACGVALFATGALMSLDKLSYAVMLTTHRVAPLAALVALVLAVYLLVGKG